MLLEIKIGFVQLTSNLNLNHYIITIFLSLFFTVSTNNIQIGSLFFKHYLKKFEGKSSLITKVFW